MLAGRHGIIDLSNGCTVLTTRRRHTTNGDCLLFCLLAVECFRLRVMLYVVCMMMMVSRTDPGRQKLIAFVIFLLTSVDFIRRTNIDNGRVKSLKVSLTSVEHTTFRLLEGLFTSQLKHTHFTCTFGTGTSTHSNVIWVIHMEPVLLTHLSRVTYCRIFTALLRAER